MGGVDPVDGPVLFNTDPSGTFTKYLACAIGSAQEGATSMLQEIPLPYGLTTARIRNWL